MHEQQQENEPAPGFIPIHGQSHAHGRPPGAGISPYDGLHYNQAGVSGPYGFYNPAHPPKDHYDPYNPYEQYDINPNGIPQGKPPQPTSQSDLFNILGAGPPGSVGNKGNAIGHHQLPPHVRIEHILQHLHQNAANSAHNGPVVVVAELPAGNNSGDNRPNVHAHHVAGMPAHAHHLPGPVQHHPQYVPIVHSGLPPPPPGHGIAIVDGQPVDYGQYPVIPGVAAAMPSNHEHTTVQQSSTSSSSTSSSSTTSAAELTGQTTEHADTKPASSTTHTG